MGSTNTTTFGKTRMPTEVAVPGDILKIAKAVTSIPSIGTVGEVVQLVANHPGYAFGHFYQYRELSGATRIWVDLSSPENNWSLGDGGSISFDLSEGKSRLLIKWSDFKETCKSGITRSPSRWTYSEILMCEVNEGTRLSERVLLTSKTRDVYKVTAYELTIELSQEEFVKKTFYLRSWFEDGSYAEVALTNNGVIIDS